MAVRHRIRADGNGKTKVMSLTARRAIIEHCKECMGFNSHEVRRCTSKLCPLYPFRTHDKAEGVLDMPTWGNLSAKIQRSEQGEYNPMHERMTHDFTTTLIRL
jgi:hypothetical protein